MLFASPVGPAQNSSTFSPLVNALKSYPNVHMRNVNLWTFAAGTPFENWINKGDLFHSEHIVAHTSDALRLMALYRFGGIYMDLDVVVLKSFENVKPNFSGFESENQVESAIMGFTQSGIGHEIVARCAR